MPHPRSRKSPVALATAYRLLTPKPLVLISTVDREGETNVSTAAWVTFLSSNPPILAVSLGMRRTLRNIKNTGEFVINVPDVDLAEEAFIVGDLYSKKSIPFRANKFSLANLTPTQAKKNRAPLVEECFAHLECEAIRFEPIGSNTMIIAKVVSASADIRRFNRNLVIRPEFLKALMLVSGNSAAYTTAHGMQRIRTKHARERSFVNARTWHESRKNHT